ncbi:MAG TPA: HPF/RaiA family ribosome-associated protein [Polyangia bacterium]|jgi:ribosomal subunit interface protein|nr:HPF/RaiA family ribosome-associated protein [Polyangia bacterium]
MKAVAEGSARGQFPVELRSPDWDLTEGVRQYALDHIAAKLEKHADHIQSVIIRFEDVNGSKGGGDKTCRIEVLLAHMRPLVVHENHHDLRAAMDLAADRVERSVGREIERMRDRPRDGDRRSVRRL